MRCAFLQCVLSSIPHLLRWNSVGVQIFYIYNSNWMLSSLAQTTRYYFLSPGQSFLLSSDLVSLYPSLLVNLLQAMGTDWANNLCISWPVLEYTLEPLSPWVLLPAFLALLISVLLFSLHILILHNWFIIVFLFNINHLNPVLCPSLLRTSSPIFPMESGGSLFKVGKLTIEIFHSWKQKFKLVHSYRELARHLSPDGSAPAEAEEFEAWLAKDDKTMPVIGTSLPNEHLNQVESAKCSSTMWTSLLHIF